MFILSTLYIFNNSIKKIFLETTFSNGLPGVYIVGLPGRVIEESSIRIKEGILNSDLEFPEYKIIINLSPANIIKKSSLFDLPIALSILLNNLIEKYKKNYLKNESKSLNNGYSNNDINKNVSKNKNNVKGNLNSIKNSNINNETIDNVCENAKNYKNNENIKNRFNIIEQIIIYYFNKFLILGETGLDGSIKKNSNLFPFVLNAKKFGYKYIIFPEDNYEDFKEIINSEELILLKFKTIKEVFNLFYNIFNMIYSTIYKNLDLIINNDSNKIEKLFYEEIIKNNFTLNKSNNNEINENIIKCKIKNNRSKNIENVINKGNTGKNEYNKNKYNKNKFYNNSYNSISNNEFNKDKEDNLGNIYGNCVNVLFNILDYLILLFISKNFYKNIENSRNIEYFYSNNINGKNNFINNKDIEFISKDKIEDDKKQFEYKFEDYVGGYNLKKGLLIAASGFHNVLLRGPSGTGKTFLSKCLGEILPPMTYEERIELTNLFAMLGLLEKNGLLRKRGIRTPHHSSSEISLIGGGSFLAVGEVTLAHRGLLILDEVNLFRKSVIEALREPITELKVSISKYRNKIVLPSLFLLLIIQNLCPCGNLGSSSRICICSKREIELFNKKLSNTIIDRIDLILNVEDVDFDKKIYLDRETYVNKETYVDKEKYLNKKAYPNKKIYPCNKNTEENNRFQLNTSKNMYDIIKKVQEIQIERYKDKLNYFNGKVARDKFLRAVKLNREVEKYLLYQVKSLNISYRKYEKIIRVARTIADIENKNEIEANHIDEAIYFVKDEKIKLTL